MKRIRKVKIILRSHYEYFGITFVFIWGCRQLFENAHFILHVVNSLTFLSAIKRAARSLLALDSPECLCHHREESPLHFFIDCFLYLPERQTLFERFEHYIPNFPNFPKYKKLDTILRGIHIENPDLLPLNTTLTIAVQNFILHTKRFSE